jgi:hypothetical protein
VTPYSLLTDDHVAFVFRRPVNGGDTFIRIVGNHLKDYAEDHSSNNVGVLFVSPVLSVGFSRIFWLWIYELVKKVRAILESFCSVIGYTPKAWSHCRCRSDSGMLQVCFICGSFVPSEHGVKITCSNRGLHQGQAACSSASFDVWRKERGRDSSTFGWQVWTESFVRVKSVYGWVEMFRSSRTCIVVADRKACPSTAANERNMDLAEPNIRWHCRVNIAEIAARLGINVTRLWCKLPGLELSSPYMHLAQME